MYLDQIVIKTFSQQIAETIQAVLNMDITIIDNNLLRIAGTGVFTKTIGEKVHIGYISSSVIKNVQPCFVADPKNSPICIQCIEREYCNEKACLLVPIKMESSAIGAIGIFAYTDNDKCILNDNYESYKNFMEKMADLLVSKIRSHDYATKTDLLAKKLNTIIQEIPYCIMSIDYEGNITHFNKTAEAFLGINARSVINSNFKSVLICNDISTALLTEKSVSNSSTKFKSVANNNLYDVILSVQVIKNDNKIDSIICFFQGYHNTRKVIEEISSNNAKNAFSKIKGDSPEIKSVIDFASRVAISSSTILLTGESGTGKELFAKSIHDCSSRKNYPFVAVNCSSIPETLLESELFGYEEGAFTGSKKSGKKGKFEVANNGTLFLDEIGDMDFNLQAKLLRALEEHSIEKLGSVSSIDLDLRIISATNKNLEEMVGKGLFREDLYYRLNVIPIHLPPLRYRKSDLRMLANYFLNKYNKDLSKNILGMDTQAFNILYNYDWPGNIRELANAIEYAVHMEIDNYIHYNSLPQKILNFVNSNIYKQKNIDSFVNLKQASLNSDCDKIREAIALFGKDTESKKKAAQYLGISLSTLYRKLAEEK